MLVHYLPFASNLVHQNEEHIEREYLLLNMNTFTHLKIRAENKCKTKVMACIVFFLAQVVFIKVFMFFNL